MFNRILSGDYPRSRALSALLVLIGVCLALGPFPFPGEAAAAAVASRGGPGRPRAIPGRDPGARGAGTRSRPGAVAIGRAPRAEPLLLLEVEVTHRTARA